MKLACPESQNCVLLKCGKMVLTSGGTSPDGAGSSALVAESAGVAEDDCGAMLRDDGVGASGNPRSDRERG